MKAKIASLALAASSLAASLVVARSESPTWRRPCCRCSRTTIPSDSSAMRCTHPHAPGKLRFETLEPRRMLASGAITGSFVGRTTIPDNGGFGAKAVTSVLLAGAPAGAVVTGVDVDYSVDHARTADLRVYATTQRAGVWYDHLYLWDREPGTSGIQEIESGLADWNGLAPNGTWYVVAGDFAAGAVGAVTEWSVTVHWATPEPLSTISEGRLAWHTYTSYDALDGRIHVYDFAAQAEYQRATETIAAAVTHAHNPVFSGDGRYLAFMGLPSGPAYGANWRTFLDVFVYDFTTDRVTNLSAALGLNHAGQIEEDPAISPDGAKVVFKRNTADIWEAGLHGGGLRQVTTGPGEKSGPQYSPDGANIVFWVGAGAGSSLATAPTGAATPVVPTPLHDNAGVQDYFPSYWDEDRIVYTSWRAGGAQDDDVKIWNVASGVDAFAAFNSSQAEDSDPFRLTTTTIGFSTTRDGGPWQLWYGDPVTGVATPLGISVAGKHNLGAKYTTAVVVFAPPSSDFNEDAAVDGTDFLAWQRGYPLVAPHASLADGDADHDQDVDQADLAVWRVQYGTAPQVVALAASAADSAADEVFASAASLRRSVAFYWSWRAATDKTDQDHVWEPLHVQFLRAR